MHRIRTLALLVGALSAAPLVLGAQTPAASPLAAQAERLGVFVDCQSMGCDFDFFRREITFVDYMRDRRDADVHVLVTSQATGSGGAQYVLHFIGQRRFQGVSDTLRHVSPQTASQDDVRRGLANVIKLGLVRYVADTPLAGGLRITYEAPKQAEAATTRRRDPWNSWTFRSSLRGNLNGESTYGSNSVSGSFSANRTTEAWKTRMSVNGNVNHQRFELGDRTVRNEQESYGMYGLLVKSLGEHLSAGATTSLNRSTYSNQDLSFRLAPAVEYNFFPYAESSRRQLTAQYSVGTQALDYQEETIYGRMEEMLFDQALRISMDARQPWGSTSLGLEGAHYLHDLSKRRLSVNGSMDLRLVKGLSLSGFVSAARINDQLFLRKGNATPEQILLRQRQLATSYRYFASLGFSYTFGSPVNNVVNPRFGNAGGDGGSFCFCS